MDARGYEKSGDAPLRNLSDGHGHEYLCFIPMLGNVTRTPTPEASTPLDGWTADQY